MIKNDNRNLWHIGLTYILLIRQFLSVKQSINLSGKGLGR